MSVWQGVEAALGAGFVYWVLTRPEKTATLEQQHMFRDHEWVQRRPEVMASLQRIHNVAQDEWGQWDPTVWRALLDAVDFCCFAEANTAGSKLVRPTLPRDCGQSMHIATSTLSRVWERLSSMAQERCKEAVNMLHNICMHSEKSCHRISMARIPGLVSL